MNSGFGRTGSRTGSVSRVAESFRDRTKEAVTGGFSMKVSDSLGGLKSGRIFGRMEHADGSVDLFDFQNKVTAMAGIVLARLVKDNREADLYGAQYLALGQGDSGWDPQNPPDPSGEETRLESEVIRKEFSSREFIDIDGNVSVAPTNTIDLTAIFGSGEAVAPLMEMGIIGGDGTSAPYSGSLMTIRNFKVINKPTASIFTIVYRCTF